MTATTPGGFTLEESARRLGHFRWIEMRLFELLGLWVQRTPEPEVKVWLANVSRHHGWHAELLGERLPEVRDLSPDRQTVAPDAEMAGFVDALAAIDGPSATVERLVGVYRVLMPRLVDAYDAHLSRCTPVADQAVARSLRLIVADLAEDAAAGAEFLAALGSPANGDTSADPAGASMSTLELLLSASRGISGP